MDLTSITYRDLKNRVRLPISRKAIMRVILWNEQKGLCHYCDEPTLLHSPTYETLMATLEHICPKSQGGPNHIRNFVMSCQGCNNRRSSLPYATFCQAMGLDLTEGRRRIALKREKTWKRKRIKHIYKARQARSAAH
jgi:5-methylcytosine-specific restriction endonuclease McrA